MFIKPCPFCGSTNKSNVVHLANRHTSYRVVCGKCGASGKPIHIKNKDELDTLQEKAIEAWNKRVSEKE